MFANLPKEATIFIYTVSGRKVNIVFEKDGDGGVLWDMKDEGGNKIHVGTYLYRVTSPDLPDDFIGKFSVVE